VVGGISNILWLFIGVVVGRLVRMLRVLLFKGETAAIGKRNNGNDSSVGSENVFCDEECINERKEV
ncbi:hypothetical protein, partial [Staphylococcus epidermidis]|uniref:hypothetical protein n=1 Tax=Staphylococcus epidermidis TaxID=1282 RepID=UPI001C92E7C6